MLRWRPGAAAALSAFAVGVRPPRHSFASFACARLHAGFRAQAEEVEKSSSDEQR
jgi:hypothetical protein